jgi:hypothetical protein
MTLVRQSLQVRQIWRSVTGQIDTLLITHEAASELEGAASEEEGAALDSGAAELDSGAWEEDGCSA